MGEDQGDARSTRRGGDSKQASKRVCECVCVCELILFCVGPQQQDEPPAPLPPVSTHFQNKHTHYADQVVLDHVMLLSTETAELRRMKAPVEVVIAPYEQTADDQCCR